MRLSQLCDEVATFALRAPHFSTRRLRTLNRLPIVIVRSSGAFELYYSYFKSCNSAMAQSKSLSSDPEELLQFMDNLDSDFSDDDFEGYIDEDEWLEERMGRQISVQQEDGSGNSVVSVHGSRKRMNSNGMGGVVNDDGRNGSEDGDGTEGSDNGDRMDGSENGDRTDGSENGDRMVIGWMEVRMVMEWMEVTIVMGRRGVRMTGWIVMERIEAVMIM